MNNDSRTTPVGPSEEAPIASQAPTDTPAPAPPAAQAVIREIVISYWRIHAVYAVAKLGIPDLLAAGAANVDALAIKLGVNPQALYRLARATASLGILRETEPRWFENTRLSQVLRSDVPDSIRSFTIMHGDMHMPVWNDFLHSIETGKPTFDKVYGKAFFDHLREHTADGKLFDESMTGFTSITGDAVAAAYDFSGARTVVDLGGGAGGLLTSVLRRYPGVQGINFDLPHVIERSRPHLAAAGMLERCALVGGSLFEAVPPGADLYMIKTVIHDFEDPEALAILRNVRAAIPETGRLLVIDAVVPPTNTPSPSVFMDLNMMVITGGRERTEEEFRGLLGGSGFALVRILPAHPAMSIVEARPV